MSALIAGPKIAVRDTNRVLAIMNSEACKHILFLSYQPSCVLLQQFSIYSVFVVCDASYDLNSRNLWNITHYVVFEGCYKEASGLWTCTYSAYICNQVLYCLSN